MTISSKLKYLYYTFPLLFVGCKTEDVDKGWAGEHVSEQIGSGTLKIIDFLSVFIMYIGVIVLAVGIHDLFIADGSKKGNTAIGHILLGLAKISGAILLLCIKPISHSLLG